MVEVAPRAPEPNIRLHGAVVAVMWTLVLAGSLMWSLHQHDEGIRETARAEARTASEMDIAYLKQHHGDRLHFCGTMCVQTTLAHGTVHDVEGEVRRRLDLFPDGGLFLGPTHAIQLGSLVENALAMYRIAGSLREEIDDSILSIKADEDAVDAGVERRVA